MTTTDRMRAAADTMTTAQLIAALDNFDAMHVRTQGENIAYAIMGALAARRLGVDAAAAARSTIGLTETLRLTHDLAA